MSYHDTDNYESLFLRDIPLLDTRAPLEFARGAFPCAQNLPLLSNEEREQIGRCYKTQGQAAAVGLGHKLVSGTVRDQRMAAWRDFAHNHPEGYIYCFRGGLRSKTVQRWLREAGVEYPLIRGGYKAMREFLLQKLETLCPALPLILIAGATGTGKTRVIENLSRSCDLEGLAVHRGSAFGHLIVDQPAQIDFENALAVVIIRMVHDCESPMFVEDEGKLIGRLSVPAVMRDCMQAAPMLVIEESLARRVDVVIEDYVVDLGARYRQAFGEHGDARHQQRLTSDTDRISRRLGGERTARVQKTMERAFASKELAAHRHWIEILLAEYYDPMYRYQMEKRQGSVLFRGTREEVQQRAASTREIV